MRTYLISNQNPLGSVLSRRKNQAGADHEQEAKCLETLSQSPVPWSQQRSQLTLTGHQWENQQQPRDLGTGYPAETAVTNLEHKWVLCPWDGGPSFLVCVGDPPQVCSSLLKTLSKVRGDGIEWTPISPPGHSYSSLKKKINILYLRSWTQIRTWQMCTTSQKSCGIFLKKQQRDPHRMSQNTRYLFSLPDPKTKVHDPG